MRDNPYAKASVGDYRHLSDKPISAFYVIVDSDSEEAVVAN